MVVDRDLNKNRSSTPGPGMYNIEKKKIYKQSIQGYNL